VVEIYTSHEIIIKLDNIDLLIDIKKAPEKGLIEIIKN